MSRRRVLILAITAFVALGLAVAGCGGGGGGTTAAQPTATQPAETGGGGAGAATTLAVAADPSGAFKFDKTSLEASAGHVVIHFTNDSSVAHNLSITGNGVNVQGETFSGGSKDTIVDLQPGTYTFFCSVPGHEQAGMKGTLTVAVWVSARDGTGLPALLARIEHALDAGLARVRCELPSTRGDVIAWLRRSGRVIEEYYCDGIVTVTALVPPKVAGRLHKEFPGSTRGG